MEKKKKYAIIDQMTSDTLRQKHARFVSTTSISFRWNTCVTAVLDALLLVIAFINFQQEYVAHVPEQIMRIPDIGYFSRPVFYIDFYVFFVIYTVFLFLMVFGKNKYLYMCAVILTLDAAVLLVYTVDELFTIKLFVFMSWIITCGTVFPLKLSIPLIAGGSGLFAVFQQHPAILGIFDYAVKSEVRVHADIRTLFAYFIVAAVFSCMYRYVIMKWQECDAMEQHLNMVMSQLSTFNQQLQDAAKNRGEEAATQERLRITRDMHDSSGYVFVNIVGLMEASESSPPQDWEKTKETFEIVRSLASRGLQETRRTLRAIRDIQDPIESSLDALLEIKQLFQSVTNIKVDLDQGNMKKDYGRTINTILIRTMQEALTNAVRHGCATYIAAYFWDDGDTLTMRVKDNGIGSKQVVKGIGLAGMEERLARVGGTLETKTQVDGGFCLTITIPLMIDTEEKNGQAQDSAR